MNGRSGSLCRQWPCHRAARRANLTGLGTVPAGIACAFPISIDLVSGDEGHDFTFLTRTAMSYAKWELLWMCRCGRSRTSTRMFRIRSNLPGGHLRLTTASDGTTTVAISGGSVGWNAPTDTPPGPFTLENIGRLVFVIDPNGNGTLTVTGNQTDLCATVGSTPTRLDDRSADSAVSRCLRVCRRLRSS